MNNDSWTTALKDEIDVDWNDMFQAYPEISVHNSYNEFITKVEIPDWANMDKNYHPSAAERIGIDDRDHPLAVTYVPNSTVGGVGFKRIFMVEKSTQKPFQKMKEIWNELKMWNEEQSNGEVYGHRTSLKITISDDGKLRTAFGVPSTTDIYGIVAKTVSLYNDWRKFPNESDFRSVENLKEAMNRISRMQMSSSQLEAEINESRSLIKEQQDRISDLEGKLNKLYEEGADAMNLLEEHGVKIDAEGNVQFDSENMDETVTIPYINDLTTQYLTSSDVGSLLTISNDSSPTSMFCSGY